MSAELQATTEKVGRYRWTICGALFAATAINYIDRQMIGVLKPTLQAEFNWSESDYGDIVFWFQTAYALGFIGMGRLMDVIGPRIGYAIAFTVWTIGHIAHGFAQGVAQFAAARFVLGVGEAGNFPAALKAVGEWFPQRERAFAIGLLNAGANVGAILTPLIVPVLADAYGWRMAFVITGVASLLWVVVWLRIYGKPDTHRRVTSRELAHIGSDSVDAPVTVPWRSLFRYRQTWAYAAGKFLTDPVWWMFLFWLPDYLGKQYGLNLKGFGPPLVVIYLVSDFGSIGGGWLSSRLIRAGLTVNAARKYTMLICALAVLPVFVLRDLSSLWPAVAILAIAAAAHQAFSANLLTLPSDLFPRTAIASVAGIGGMAGGIGGMFMAKFVGWVLDKTGSYDAVFAIAGCAYLLALTVIHLLSPRLEPVLIVSKESS
jgi:MFS transporter, ACS family, hexuronate transporter